MVPGDLESQATGHRGSCRHEGKVMELLNVWWFFRHRLAGPSRWPGEDLEASVAGWGQ